MKHFMSQLMKLTTTIWCPITFVTRSSLWTAALDAVTNQWIAHEARTAHFTVTYTPNIYCIVFSAWPTKKNTLRWSLEEIDKWTLLCAARVGWTRDEVISAFNFRVRAIRWKTRNWYFSIRSNNKMRHIECERRACVSFIMGARVVINEF